MQQFSKNLNLFVNAFWQTTQKIEKRGVRGFAILGVTAIFLGSTHSSSAKEDDRLSRVSHARELLGSAYDISVAKNAENFERLGDQIHRIVQKRLPKKWMSRSQIITKTILNESLKYKLDPMFLLAIIQNESGFRPDVVGGVGEIGLMQVRPESAKWITKQTGMRYRGKKTLFNPAENIVIGCALLNYTKNSFGNAGGLYLSAYNMGVVGVERQLKRNQWPQIYSQRVLDHYLSFYSKLRTNSG